MDKTQEQFKTLGILYDNGEMGKHQQTSLSEEQFSSMDLAHEFLDSKGYFQLHEFNPYHFVKDSTDDYSLAIIVEL